MKIIFSSINNDFTCLYRGTIMGCDFCKKIWNSVKEYKEDYKERFKDMKYESEYYEEDAIVIFNGKPYLYITCEDHYYNDINRQINYCPICGRKLTEKT